MTFSWYLARKLYNIWLKVIFAFISFWVEKSNGKKGSVEEILTKTQFQSKLYHLPSYNQIFMSFPWVQWNFMPSAWHSQVKKKQRSFNSYGVPESDSPPHIFFGIRPQSLGKWQTALELELITFEILAAERLRLMGFDNRLIIDCFANVVNILMMVIFYKW